MVWLITHQAFMIINPTPITCDTMDRMWITSFRLFPDTMLADLLPYDGQRLLAVGGKTLRLMRLDEARAADEELDACVTAVLSEVARQAGNTSTCKCLSMTAPNPGAPAVAIALFETGLPLRVLDCWALAASDPVFAGVWQRTMATIARLSGCPTA